MKISECVVVMVLLLTLVWTGCSRFCRRVERVHDVCGMTFNSEDCKSAEKWCSSEDLLKMEAYFDCIEREGDCVDGKMRRADAPLGCLRTLEDVSAACIAH